MLSEQERSFKGSYPHNARFAVEYFLHGRSYVSLEIASEDYDNLKFPYSPVLGDAALDLATLFRLYSICYWREGF